MYSIILFATLRDGSIVTQVIKNKDLTKFEDKRRVLDEL